MAKPKSVYLTDRTMSALRGDEPLSGRLNQIVDRYLQMMTTYQHDLRAEFDDEQWQRVCDAYGKSTGERKTLVEICTAMIDVLDNDPVLIEDEVARRVDDLTIAELAGLFELIEADAHATTPATHS